MPQKREKGQERTEPGTEAWDRLTAEEKMDIRFSAWIEAKDTEFVSPEAKADYRARATRIMDALRLKKTPDRVPVMPSLGGLTAEYSGFSERDMLYDAKKAAAAARKATLDLQADAKAGGLSFSGEALEILDWKMHHWAGHGIGDNVGWQFIEGEYMKADDYDRLTDDPSDYWLRTFLPRAMGSLEPLSQLAPLTHFNSVTNIPTQLSRFGRPEVRQALEKLMTAGEKMLEWQKQMGAAGRQLDGLGFPGTSSGMAMAPFDNVGDGMRGVVGIISDLFRRPDKIHQTMEKITPVIIERAVAGAKLGGCPVVTLPLHKGADGFMSDAQFREFYWPPLKAVIEGLNREGLMARMFAEGGYNSRLEVIRESPPGMTAWYFDRTDMAKAKEALGGIASLQGNVPVSLIHTATPEEVYEHCRQLIETAGKDGGYILSTGASVGRGGKMENIRAMIRCAKECGCY